MKADAWGQDWQQNRLFIDMLKVLRVTPRH
jgi:hypothetical protein